MKISKWTIKMSKIVLKQSSGFPIVNTVMIVTKWPSREQTGRLPSKVDRQQCTKESQLILQPEVQLILQLEVQLILQPEVQPEVSSKTMSITK